MNKVTKKDIEQLLTVRSIQYKEIEQAGKKQLFIVITENNEKQTIFFSYRRIIGYIKNNVIYIVRKEGWSVTTKKHISYVHWLYSHMDKVIIDMADLDRIERERYFGHNRIG